MKNTAEKLEQEIDMSNDPIEIEEINDTPEADRKPKRAENVEPQIPDDDEAHRAQILLASVIRGQNIRKQIRIQILLM